MWVRVYGVRIQQIQCLVEYNFSSVILKFLHSQEAKKRTQTGMTTTVLGICARVFAWRGVAVP